MRNLKTLKLKRCAWCCMHLITCSCPASGPISVECLKCIQMPLISEISHVFLKLTDQWPLDGSGPKRRQVKSPLWRQACNTHEGGQTAFSTGICCSCQDTADSKYSKQILQTWNDLEAGKVTLCCFDGHRHRSILVSTDLNKLVRFISQS